MFATAGFELMEIDSASHFAAYIILARKSDKDPVFHADQDELKKIKKHVQAMANYWRDLQSRINDLEKSVKGRRAAIYGAGVYGSFIAATIADPDQIDLFIDQNPLLEGTGRMGKPVCPP